MAYIANKPVRFDRSYAIGEVIPDAVIDPKMTRRLVDMGRILHVDLPAQDGNDENPSSPEPDNTGGAENEESKNTQGGTEDVENPLTDGSDTEPAVPSAAGEFVCPDCGRAFGSKNALSAHSRSHKEQ